MIGYTEVLQTMAAMIIFSVILMNANHMIQRNSMMQVQSELEQEVIVLGQEVIEEGRTRSFDRVVEQDGSAPPAQIPNGFTPVSELGPDTSPDYENNFTDGHPDRSKFSDFDDYNGWAGTFITEHGEFEVSAEVFYVDTVHYEKTFQPTTFKKIEVRVTSKYLRTGTDLPREYKLEFIRNYYAD